MDMATTRLREPAPGGRASFVITYLAESTQALGRTREVIPEPVQWHSEDLRPHVVARIDHVRRPRVRVHDEEIQWGWRELDAPARAATRALNTIRPQGLQARDIHKA